MRHHRLPPRAWLVPLGLALGVATCKESVGIGSYTVTYRADVRDIVQKTGGGDSIVGGLPVRVNIGTIDSITYSNGSAKCTTNCNGDSTLVKVSNPSVTFAVSSVLPSGSLVEAHLYGSGTVAGTAQFTAVWMSATGGLSGDSATATTAAGVKFQINIAKRTL